MQLNAGVQKQWCDFALVHIKLYYHFDGIIVYNSIVIVYS